MTVTNRDLLSNKFIIDRVRQLTLAILDKVVSERDDILYRPKSPLELNAHNELINSIITRVLGKLLGHHHPEELLKQNKKLQIRPSSPLYLIDVSDGSFSNLDAKIAEILLDEVDYIKETIQPIYKQYSNSVLEAIANKSNTNPLEKFNITVLETPAVILELDNRDYFRVNEYPTILPSKSFSIPLPSDPILNYMLTGIPRVDTEVKQLYLQLGEEKVKEIWSKYIINLERLKEFSITVNIDIDTLATVYLLMKNLKNNVPDISGISLNQYEEYLNKGIEFSTKAIRKYLDMLERYSKSNLVIVSAKDTEITLLGTTYYRWLNNDNSVEPILGAVVGYNKRVLGYKELENNVTIYQEAWDKYVTKVKLNEKNKLYSYYREAYSVLLHKLVNEIEYDIAIEIGLDELDRANVEGQRYIRGLSSEELLNVDDVSLYIVGKLLFKNTNGYIFLETMKRYSRDDSRLSPKECASLSLLELIVTYLCKQVDIVN